MAKRSLNQDTIRELYESGLTVHEVARALRTSTTTLYREWPPDLPRRSQGRSATGSVVTLTATQTPQQIVDTLVEHFDPDDLADVINGLLEWKERETT